MTAEDASGDAPSTPTLVGPVDGTTVDGREITFAWKPVPEANRYRLQVAGTARFDDPVLDEDVGDETAVTVGNQFPTDEQTFFWRVTAGTSEKWGDPSAVESFIAATEEASEQQLVGVQDAAGPITGLARAAKREIKQRVFSLEDQFEEERERGVAYEGIAANQITAIALSILVVILAAVAVLFGWNEQVRQEAHASATDEQNYEMLRQAETEAQQDLTQYEVVDEEEGVYQIPIDRAMDIIATEEYQQQREASEGEETQSGQGGE